MQRQKPTKQDIIDALRRIAAANGENRASLSVFHSDTGWDRYWFDKYWPESGYRGACDEARVLPGLQFGVDYNCRMTDKEIVRRLADSIAKNKMRFPPLKRLAHLSQMAAQTICRGETYALAKRRLIHVYLALADEERNSAIEAAMRDELRRLEGEPQVISLSAVRPIVPDVNCSISVHEEFIITVRELRDRGEEEQRQLVARFFIDVLGYHRLRVRSEHERNDVRVHDRRDRPWLVVEVKPSLESDRHRQSARRQGFDYAHRKALRYVVLSDGDYYEVYDRCAGERLAYDEMRQGNFRLTALRSRDSDLLSLLAGER